MTKLHNWFLYLYPKFRKITAILSSFEKGEGFVV